MATGKKKKKSGQNRNFDIVATDASFWMKVGGGAVALPFLVLLVIARGARRGSMEVPELSGATWALALLGGAIVGALVGASFGARDYVAKVQKAGGQPPFFLRLMFGMGLISILIWVPLIIVAAGVGTALSLM